MEIKIKTGIPIPKPGRGRKVKWPFPEMKVGDCIDIPIKSRSSALSCAIKHGRKTGKTFVSCVYKDKNIARIWRSS